MAAGKERPAVNRTVFLIDMNAFFASVEQMVNPALRGKPIIVCGRGRTVVTTASYEARAFGVKTGMNLYEARRACPSVIAVEGDMARYIDANHRIQAIAREFTSQVEVFSIDEVFMDVSHLCRHPGAAEETARAFKRRLRDELGLTCSVGIGPNKVVAKLASKMQKPDGLVHIPPERIAEIFAAMPVEKLQGVGIGKHLSAKLREIGIQTAGELGAAPLERLMHHFGISGYHLQRIGLGQDDSPVREVGAEEELIKSVGHSHTFPRDTRDADVVRSYLMMLTEKVGERLREYGMMGTTVHCGVRYGDFTSFGAQHAAKRYLRHNREIYLAALHILDRALPFSKPVRLVAVSISGLRLYDRQGFLLEDMEKDNKLSAAVDDINRKYGAFTLKASSVMISETYGIRPSCGMLSKHLLK